MKYAVQIERSLIHYALVHVEAENVKDAKIKANAIPDDKLEWEISDEAYCNVSCEPVIECIPDPGIPECPACGCSVFNELQQIAAGQRVRWNVVEKYLEYGELSIHEVESVEGIECADCGKDLGEDFFQPWHQGKTRSEIYGEHEPTQPKEDA